MLGTIGSLRKRTPVAAKIALVTAGASADRSEFAHAARVSLPCTIWTSIAGASFMRRPVGVEIALLVCTEDLHPDVVLTFFLTRDAVAKATAPACTILHDPPITSRRDEPRHDAEM